MGVFSTALKMKRFASVGTPPAGVDALYFKEDGELYVKNSSGQERPLVPKPENAHTNAGFDSTTMSTQGSPNTGPVASREMPSNWHWGWSWPQDSLSYPTLQSDSSVTYSGTGKSWRVSWAGTTTVNQYLWSQGIAAPPGSVVKVKARIRATHDNITAEVGVLTADAPNPNVLSSGNAYSGTARTSSTNVWTTLERSAVVPAGHNYASLHVVVGNNGVVGDFWVDETASEVQILPPSAVVLGEIKMWPTATAPQGYLLCDGSEKAVADYPALDALLGTTFGARTDGSGGAGSTHFRLPDFRGRSPVGVGPLDYASEHAYSLGQKWGHHLMHSHDHQAVDWGHTHSLPGHVWNWGAPSTVYAQNAIAAAGNPPSNNLMTQQGSWTNTNNGTANIDIYHEGGGNAQNVPPVLAVNFIIKT